MRQDVALTIITDFRTQITIQFRFILGFKKHDLTMTKEQSILTKIMKAFTDEKLLLQHYVLGYHTPEYKLAIEVDEKGHRYRNKYKEIERQKAREKELDFELIRINPDGEDFGMYHSRNYVVKKKLPSL